MPEKDPGLGPTDPTTAMAQLSKMASREKYWSELTADEKIERMRQILKRATSEGNLNHRRLETLEDVFWGHSHDSEGNPVARVRIPNRGHGEIGRDKPGNPDEIYF